MAFAEELEQSWGTGDNTSRVFRADAPPIWRESEDEKIGSGNLIIHPDEHNSGLNSIPSPDRRFDDEKIDVGSDFRILENEEDMDHNLRRGIGIYDNADPQTNQRSLSVSTPLPRD